MPDDARAAELQRFTDALQDAWVKAAPGSYSEFEKLSRRVLGDAGALPASTTQEIVTGRRRRPPRWEWVVRYLKVLDAAARRNGLDPGRLGTRDMWKQLHEAACASQGRPEERAGIPRQRPAAAAAAAAAAARENEGALDSIRRAIGTEWWLRDYAQVVRSWSGAYLSLEPAASLIRTYDNTLVPGLLQTEQYARAALRLDAGAVSETTVGRQVELRMRRQRILDRPSPTQLWAVVDERALRRRLGSTATMREQLAHLTCIGTSPNVTIQVIPASSKVYTTLAYPLTLLRFGARELPDIAYVELLTSAFYLHEDEQVGRYRQVMEGLSLQALGPYDSAEFIRAIQNDI